MKKSAVRRVGIVTDASSDLPRAYLDAHNIAIMPAIVTNGTNRIWDTRDIAATSSFLEVMKRAPSPAYNLEYLSSQQFRDFFAEHLVLNYDDVFYVTSAASRSPVLQIANKASEGIISNSVAPRHQLGIDELFRMHVIDSTVIFAGLGLIVSDIAARIVTGADSTQVTQRINLLKQHTQTFAVPMGLTELYYKAKETGDNSLGFTKYALGKAFNIKPIVRCYRGNTEPVAEIMGYGKALKKLFTSVAAAVRSGLLVNAICISYAGNTDELSGYEGYSALLEVAAGCGVDVHTCVSSPVSAVYLGANVLTLGVASQKPIEIH